MISVSSKQLSRRCAGLAIMLCTVLMLVGCTQGTSAPPPGTNRTQARTAPAPSPSPQPIYGIIGLDCTGSFALADFARGQAAKVILASPPGSTWIVRWITRESYSDRAHVLRVSIPALPAKPTNPFDQRGRDAYVRALAQSRAVARQAAAAVASASFLPIEGTDCNGFFGKASELLADAPAGHRRLLVVCSDLGDTENRPVTLSLHGMPVFILFQSGASPHEADAVRNRWRGILEEAGAEVHFVDASQDLAAAVAGTH